MVAGQVSRRSEGRRRDARSDAIAVRTLDCVDDAMTAPADAIALPHARQCPRYDPLTSTS
ncbi:hypothetical protein WM40_18530 [Robbsia andropogonis]|uniref:Uncharacterized protein n=1 Tax=Robbsia andropogonis TaxID=28092 RepID=A0A0F5JWP9_9BURK|nr:hypothetical protein WM40_18530 [Robbsia andropogonis]